MTGNGKHSTYNNGDDWGMVYNYHWCLYIIWGYHIFRQTQGILYITWIYTFFFYPITLGFVLNTCMFVFLDMAFGVTKPIETPSICGSFLRGTVRFCVYFCCDVEFRIILVNIYIYTYI